MRASKLTFVVPLFTLTGCPQFLNDFDVGSGTSGADGSLSNGSSGSGGTTQATGGTSATGGASAGGGTGSTEMGGSSPSSGGTSGSDGGVACSTGEVRCSGAQPQTCVSGIWLGNGSACSVSTPVCLKGLCVVCNPGETKCVSTTQPQTCSSTGSWQDDTACTGTAQACLNGVCASCSSGTVLHDDGLGQAFCDTVPAGTINNQLALDACAAYAAVNGGGTCMTSGCICYRAATECACWNAGGANVGYVHVEPTVCACSDSVGTDTIFK